MDRIIAFKIIFIYLGKKNYDQNQYAFAFETNRLIILIAYFSIETRGTNKRKEFKDKTLLFPFNYLLLLVCFL